MPHPHLAKTVFNCTCITGLFVAGVIYGVSSEAASRAMQHVKDSFVTVIREAGTYTGTEPAHYLQPAFRDGSGVVVNADPGLADELVFVTGFFDNNNELRLMRRDGAIVARWPVRFSDIFPNANHLPEPPVTDWNIDIHGALALPDGSVVFNFDYGGLVKLDRCGDIVWTLAHPTHHSVERAEGGGFWVPGRRFHSDEARSAFLPFRPPFSEDRILRVSESGEILTDISIPQLFYDNDLEAVLTSTGHSFDGRHEWDEELVHVNKIEELTSDIAKDFPQFAAGDLALSFRTLNLVMVIEPDSGTVKWWRIGPWIRQHDPAFRAGGTIVVFNNNTYRTVFDAGLTDNETLDARNSNIIEIDPATDEHEVVYGSAPDEQFRTVIRGKAKVTPRGGLLVTEFEAGRIFEVDAEGSLIWEYINRYDEQRVLEVTEARLYPKGYFEVNDWSCERR